MLLDTSIDIAEISIDQLLDNEVVQQIPIVKTVAGIIQAGVNIQDRLFLKKILTFLQNIDDIPEKERKKIIDKIDNSGKHRIKVGEKLLYIIDSCDDHIHAENVAKLFTAMLRGKVTYSQYIDAAQIVSRVSQSEIDLFMASYKGYFIDDSAIALVHTGLVYTEVEDIEVEVEKHEQADYDDPPEYYDTTTHGGGTVLRATDAGETVFEILGIGKVERIKQLKQEHDRKKVEVRASIDKLRSNKP